VSVVDDDESIRESLPDLLEALGFAAQAFASAADFLASGAAARSACLILDVAMPEMSGPDLQRELRRRGVAVPIIFITAHADEAVHALGAVACLRKPFTDTQLLHAIERALAAEL
jgi:FixJ family two-component response regulator